MNNFLQKNIYIIIAVAFWSFNTYSQCASHIPYLGNDTIICANASFTLNGYPNALGYTWSNGDSVSSISVDSPGGYWCQSIFMDSTNLVQNGDFELGDTLFSSAHTYGNFAGGNPLQLLWGAGQYAIATNPNSTHSGFASCTDHTSGSGNMMVVNGATTPNMTIWCQTISVTPNTNYFFSAWFTSVHSSNPAQLSFTADGVALGTNISLSSTTCLWQNFAQTWSSGPSQNSVTICITNQVLGGGGNDFAIDDIYFAEECVMVDSIQVNMVGPTVNLGPDTTICIGDTAYFDITDTISSTAYTWSNGPTTPTLAIDSAFTGLIATATNNGCTDADTINISILDTPNVVFPNDTTMCTGSHVILNMNAPQASYLWHNNYTGSGFYANQAGTIWGQASNMCGTSSDTMIITLESPIPINLGNDTTLCNNATMVSYANVSANNYLWSNGAIQDSILIVTPGTYALSITNSCGTFSDNINVSYEFTPNITIGTDTITCINTPVQIGDSWPNSTFIWSTGATSSFITPTVTNNYWLIASNYCGTDTSSVNITYENPIVFNLGPDTTICMGDSILLAPNITNVNWDWNTGSTDSAIYISSAGWYVATGTNVCGPETDSIYVTHEQIPQIPLPVLDTAFCVGNIYQVVVPQHNATSILWSNGSAYFDNQFLDSGLYSYTLTNMCGTNSDSFYVGVEYPIDFSLGGDTLICSGEQIIKEFSLPNHTYQWTDGETKSTRIISEPGLYGLTIFTPLGCESFDEFEVSSCGADLFVPSAFTPNGDGLNETFAIKGVQVYKYRIEIYDRWGMLVFASTNLTQPWNGTINGDPANAGLYTYRIWYNSGQESKSRTYTGTVTLIR